MKGIKGSHLIKKTLVVYIIVSLLLILQVNAGVTDLRDNYYMDTGQTMYVHVGNKLVGVNNVTQTFTVLNGSFYLQRADVVIFDHGFLDPSNYGNATLSLRGTDGSGIPLTTNLTTSRDEYHVDDLPTGINWGDPAYKMQVSEENWTSFSFGNYSVYNNTIYGLYFYNNVSAVAATQSEYMIIGNFTGSNYPYGSLYKTLTTNTTYDAYFRLIGEVFWVRNETPTNASVDADLCPQISVNVSNVEGNDMTINWSWLDGDTWEHMCQNTSATNGTYYCSFDNATDCCTSYYWTVSINDSFDNYQNETYFFTTVCPEPPTTFSASINSSTSLNLTWTNWTVPATCSGNSSTMIRYSASTYPNSITDGTFAYNGTLETFIVEGLLEDTAYYFSAWTFYNSTYSGCWSDTYSTASADTGGGIYNITIYWDCNLSLVNPAGGGFLNSALWAELITGQQIHYNTSFTTNPMTIYLTSSPTIWSFDYNNLSMVRSVIPSDSHEIEFYICCRPEYNGSNLNESQVWYTFSFIDTTVNYRFVSNPETEFHIYKYNGSSLYYVHKDYLSATKTVRVCLNYNDRYFVGMKCPEIFIPFLQYIDTGDDTTPDITIIPDINSTQMIQEFCSFNLTWDSEDDGLWINYTDTTFLTENVTIRIYIIYPNNDTKIYVQTATYSDVSNFNYQWTNALGCNTSTTYYVELEISHELFSTNNTMNGFIFYWPPGVVSADWIDSVIDEIFGRSPFYPVSWTQCVVFSCVFTFLIVVGNYDAPAGLIVGGFALVFIEGAFLLQSLITLQAVGVGILLIMFGIMFSFGRNRLR